MMCLFRRRLRLCCYVRWFIITRKSLDYFNDEVVKVRINTFDNFSPTLPAAKEKNRPETVVQGFIYMRLSGLNKLITNDVFVFASLFRHYVLTNCDGTHHGSSYHIEFVDAQNDEHEADSKCQTHLLFPSQFRRIISAATKTHTKCIHVNWWPSKSLHYFLIKRSSSQWIRSYVRMKKKRFIHSGICSRQLSWNWNLTAIRLNDSI